VEEALKKNIEDPKKESKKFILKSSMTNKGAEILIFDTRRQLESYFHRRVSQNEDEMLDLREWVIQEYVDKPLLLKHYNWRKFHLRVYVLAVGNLRVYVYRDILALFAYKSYSHCKRVDEETASDSAIDICSHITNTCVQMDALETDAEEKRRAESECVKRFWDLRLAEGNGHDTEDQELTIDVKNAVYEQIKRCVAELFECFSCEPTVFQPLENAFELYGLDFLIDRNFQVLFLEANAFPDFKQTGDSLNDLIDGLFYQTISAACDPHFGLPPVSDTDMLSLVFSKQLNR
jgi:tubulin--tyrosine ligase